MRAGIQIRPQHTAAPNDDNIDPRLSDNEPARAALANLIRPANDNAHASARFASANTNARSFAVRTRNRS